MSFNQRRRPPSPRRDGDRGMFQFRGSNNNNSSSAGNYNNNHEFSFRPSGRPAPSFPARPSLRDRIELPRDRGNRDYPPRGPRRGDNNNRNRFGPGSGFRGGYRKPGASQRAILHARRSPTPEQMEGMANGGSKFRALEDLPSQSEDSDVEEVPRTGEKIKQEAEAITIVELSDEDDHPRAKRAKTAVTAPEDDKPKWSNPDPYTALPPPGGSTGPKTDVLGLIRKARMQAESAAAKPAGVDEFISLDFGDDAEEQPEPAQVHTRTERTHPPSYDDRRENSSIHGMRRDGPLSARGERASYGREEYRRDDPYDDYGYGRYRRDRSRSPYYDRPFGGRDRSRSYSPPRREFRHDRYSTSPEAFDRRRSDYSPPGQRSRYAQPDPRSRYSPARPRSPARPIYREGAYSTYQERSYGEQTADRDRLSPSQSRYNLRGERAPPPPPPASYSNAPPPPPMARDPYAWPPPPPAPAAPIGAPAGPGVGKKRKNRDGGVAAPTLDVRQDWLPDIDQDATPWMVHCKEGKLTPHVWLNDEVDAYFAWLSPRQFECDMRDDLVDRVTRAITKGMVGPGANFGTVRVYPFGSSAGRLYLPTSDVDLVVLSSNFEAQRRPMITLTFNSLNRFAKNVVRNTGLGYETQVIAKAKVPLVKFVDAKTGLPIDVSFENASGLPAIVTLERWIADYPALGRIVQPIKIFLKMRGVNEVNTGGLGGFCTICLVAFRLHLLSQEKGQRWAQQNVGLALLDFFEYYGDRFDPATTAIDMSTMRGLPVDSPSLPILKEGRLMVVDPNLTSNNISGGSSKFKEIFAMFSLAAKVLRSEMQMASNAHLSGKSRWSMLNCILGANYQTFIDQRQRMRALYYKQRGFTPGMDNIVDISVRMSDDASIPVIDLEAEPSGGADLASRIEQIPGSVQLDGNGDNTPSNFFPPNAPQGPKSNGKKSKAEKKQANAAQANAAQKRKGADGAPQPPAKKKKQKQKQKQAQQAQQPPHNAPKAPASQGKGKSDPQKPGEPSAPKKRKNKGTAKKAMEAARQSRADKFEERFPDVPYPEGRLSKHAHKKLVRRAEAQHS